MYRAFSASLAAHAALLGALLLLSALQPPLRIVEAPRQVRLVATLDLPRARAPRVPGAAPRVVAPPPEAPVKSPPPTAAEPTADRVPPPAPAPVAVPRIALPGPATAPPAPPRAAPRPPAPAAPAAGLGERLASRISSVAPAPEAAIPGPRIVDLAPAEIPAPKSPPAAAATAREAATPAAVVPLADFPHAWYLALVKQLVFDQWARPSEILPGGGRAPALVGFRIDRAGRVSRIALKEGSGSARFDQSAVAAVQSLKSLPFLPEQYPEETLDVVVRFQNQ